MKKPLKGGAVCYVRISSEEQLKRSAENAQTQARKIHLTLSREGIEILKTFYDEGESAYTSPPVIEASSRPHSRSCGNTDAK